jgi:dTDP-glucose pyrophosphorylase
MLDFIKHTIQTGTLLKEALRKLNKVPQNLSLFVLNANKQLIGTLTDGDIRRGLLDGLPVDSSVDEFMFKDFHAIYGNPDPRDIQELKKLGIKLVPVLDDSKRITQILDLKIIRSCLPVDAVIMAGGRGERLRPLTDKVPKPMLPLGNKPIIEHNVDRLKEYGISNIHISINYMGQQVIDHFGNGNSRNLNIRYVTEDKPLGTIGLTMQEQEADLCVASIPYTVNIPFAIMERSNGCITGLKEKPSNTHYANAGIYLFRKEFLKLIPYNEKFNATDFIELVIGGGGKVIDNPITGYWIDIGRHEEYEKAKTIISHIKK